MADGIVSMPRGQGGSSRAARLRSAPMCGVFVRGSDKRSPLVKDVANELAGLEPFTDEETKRRERVKKQMLEIERELEEYSKGKEFDVQTELQNRLLDFDTKQGGEYYTRFYFTDLRYFDLDEESPIGPMRFTNTVWDKDQGASKICGGINIFSVKISCSDVGFPIHVYGTVIARDSIDNKCIYLFRRDRDHCQTINSEDESLVLTGPKRGLAVISNNYIETDLKIKDHQGNDRELSKGFLTIRGVGPRSRERCTVGSVSLETRLSTVDVVYGFVAYAVEGTIAIEVIQGYFDGQITAHTTSIQNRIVLYDRELYGDEMTGNDGTGVIQLVRPVVSVSAKEMLVIVAKTRDGKSEGTIEFTPRINGAEQDVISIDGAQMRVNVTWSLMD